MSGMTIARSGLRFVKASAGSVVSLRVLSRLTLAMASISDCNLVDFARVHLELIRHRNMQVSSLSSTHRWPSNTRRLRERYRTLSDGTGVLWTIAAGRPLSVCWFTLRRFIRLDCSAGVELKTFQLHEDQCICDPPIVCLYSYPPELLACC